jgi:hypothetical protein
VLGNLLQMAFRFWAFRRWVFPDEFGPSHDKGLESTLTGGGFAEAMEDEYEAGATVTPLRRRRASRQLGDSSEPRVSKTS